MGKFLIRQVDSGIKFDLLATNGQVILTSEVYEAETSCRNGIASIRRNAPEADLDDQTLDTDSHARCPKFELYQDKAGEYRFRLKATNGQIIGISEGYKAKASCLNGIDSVRRNASDAEIVTA